MRLSVYFFCFLFAIGAMPGFVNASEMAVLTAETWEEYAPQGKEVDSIYGDFVLRNERLVAVVAKPVKGRNANTTVKQVGGAVIDLTERHRLNDQLSAFYPGARQYPLQLQGLNVLDPDVKEEPGKALIEGPSVELRCISPAREGHPEIELIYSLKDGEPYLRVTSIYRNPWKSPLMISLVDEVRADNTFEKTRDGESKLFWVYDKWFGQAYGILAEDHTIQSQGDEYNRATALHYLKDGQETVKLGPGQKYVLSRRLFPKANLVGVKSQARLIDGESLFPVSLNVTDAGGQPVADADVALLLGGRPYGNARTSERGRVAFPLPPGKFRAKVSALGRGSREVSFQVTGSRKELSVEFPIASRVVTRVSDVEGNPIACKVQFLGIEGTESPHFGPDSGEHAVHNLYYSHDGRFTQILPPGTYQVIISHGPEYEAVFTRLEVGPGQEVPLRATLKRVVNTTGWVSADFHSHSSPSGDNTGSQFGRVLNLVAEHLEFAPCTEHNRLSTYVPHLKRLGIEQAIATATGIELTEPTRTLSQVNHQNAFPLIVKPHTQDWGGPLPHEDPPVQIERLALWDSGSEKLVQENHPDIGQLFFDKDGDGQPDGGFKKMFGYMDVIEVHPLENIIPFQVTYLYTYRQKTTVRNHRIFNWLQLLNQGYRIPGVVNTDAHYNFHGSGWLRNYLRSPTDDPAQIKTLDIVHAAERGNLIMTNGPFLEVHARAAGEGPKGSGTAGDDIRAPGGKLTLHVRVQCPNWFDVDRVQILINGQPDPLLNHTRVNNPALFSDDVVKFDYKIQVELKSDAHLIVVAVGENSELGPVMGPERGKAAPLAVSNPIYVDVDGGGFEPNGDTLGSPLPVRLDRPVEKSAKASN